MPAQAHPGEPSASPDARTLSTRVLSTRERATDLVTASAMGVLRRAPTELVDPASRIAARLLGERPNAALRQWQRNVELATGRRPDADLTAAAVRSWARMMSDAAQLGDWDGDRLRAVVEISEQDLARLQRAHAGRGAVLALPHLGSWDLAGAWVGAMGMPVSTVAEQLAPATHEFFVASRQRMGMRVHPHTAPDLLNLLTDDLRAGRLACLLSDRGDLTRWGTRVEWPTPGGALDVRVPNGAARLATRTGAALFAVTTWNTSGGLHIDISDELTAEPGPGQVRRLCQQLVHHFAVAVAQHSQDWHMLVPFFEQGAPGSAARGHASGRGSGEHPTTHTAPRGGA